MGAEGRLFDEADFSDSLEESLGAGGGGGV